MHEIRKPSDEKPSHPEKIVLDQELLTLRRQVFAMARIYHAIYENDNRKYDRETGYVLFQELAITEGMPLLLDGINNPEKAAADIEKWNNRTTEIESTTQYRVKLTGDAVLIEISNT